MPAIVGTPTAITWAAGADPAGQAVPVDASALWALMFWSYFPGSLGQGLASGTLGGAAPTQVFEVASLDGEPAAGVSIWRNPTTGTPTLDVAWDAAPGDGPNTIFVCTNDSDIANARDIDGANGEAAAALTVTVDAVVGDLVLKWDSRFASTPPALSATWTNVATQTNVGGYSSRVSSIIAAATTQVANAENESYSGLIVVTIPDAAAAGLALLPTFAQRMNTLIRL